MPAMAERPERRAKHPALVIVRRLADDERAADALARLLVDRCRAAGGGAPLGTNKRVAAGGWTPTGGKDGEKL